MPDDITGNITTTTTEISILKNVFTSIDDPNSKIYFVPMYDWIGNSINTWVFDTKTHEVYKRKSFGDYQSKIKFLASENCGIIGFFFAPYGEDINISENVKYVSYNYVEDTFLFKKDGSHSVNDETIISGLIEDYQQRVKVNDYFYNNDGLYLESNAVTIDSYIHYLEKSNRQR